MFAMAAAGSSPLARYTLNNLAVLLRLGPRMRSCAGRTCIPGGSRLIPPGWEREGQPDRQSAGCQFPSAGQHPAHDLRGATPSARRMANPPAECQQALAMPCNPEIVRASANSSFR
jgi:hypothetical protein